MVDESQTPDGFNQVVFVTNKERHEVAFRLGDSGRIDGLVKPLLAHALHIANGQLYTDYWEDIPSMVEKVWGFSVQSRAMNREQFAHAYYFIRSNGLIGQEPLAAFLSMTRKSASSDFFAGLTACLFWATCRELRAGEHRSSLHTGVDRARIDQNLLKEIVREGSGSYTPYEMKRILESDNKVKWHPIITLIDDGIELNPKRNVGERRTKKKEKPARSHKKKATEPDIVLIDPLPGAESASGEFALSSRTFSGDSKLTKSPPDPEYLSDNPAKENLAVSYRAEVDQNDALPGEDARSVEGRRNSQQKCAASSPFDQRYPTRRRRLLTYSVIGWARRAQKVAQSCPHLY